MKTIVLKKLTLHNFAGVPKFTFAPDGKNATVKAENGVGKTTLYNGFLWPIFNKNAYGDTQFGNRPYDKDKQPREGLEVSSELVLCVDGVDVNLKRIETENVVKRQIKGFSSAYEIDGVPKLKKDFDKFIAEIIDEEAFRMLTDTDYFNGKLHHTERRKILIDLAGNIPTPQGFADLLEDLTGRNMDDYKTVLTGQRKKHEEERKGITPRIDEIQKGYEQYVGDVNLTELEGKRNGIKFTMGQIREQRDDTAKIETKRAETTKAITDMRTKQADVVTSMASDTSGITNLMDEKLALNQTCIEVDGKHQESQGMLTRAITDRDESVKQLNHLRELLQKEEAGDSVPHEKLKDAEAILDEALKIKVVDTCLACKQTLPENLLQEATDRNQKTLDQMQKNVDGLKTQISENLSAINKDGKDFMAQMKAAKSHVESCESSVKSFATKLAEAKKVRDVRCGEIDEQVKGGAKADPSSNPIWQKFETAIAELEQGMPESVAEQLAELNDDYDAKQVLVDEINNMLSQSDRVEKDQERIKELQDREKELAQLIADIDCTIDQMGAYAAEESRLIEKAVNGKFKHVEFKLFKQRLNGSIEPDCIATYKGVPYGDLSTGQKIYIGIDIINTLSEHFGMSVVLFVDRSESLTMPIESTSQVIRLQAVKNKKKLAVTME